MDRGEPVADCLAEVDDSVRQVKGMLEMASTLAAMPRVEPPPQFRETAQGRLMARLGQEASRVKVAELEQRVPVVDDVAAFGQRLWQALTRGARLAVPASLTLLVAVVLVFTASNLRAVPAALASECTLSILGGNVEVSGPSGAQTGADGMTLQAGTRISTSADAHAILTFFDGSTVTLEPGTEIEIQQVATDSDQNVTIVMKQWVGRTWSRVVKMADAGSRYEIETPTATAIVRGTLFATDVGEQGETTVATTEGLVSVAARGEEVFIPPQQQTSVGPGETPAAPSTSPEPVSEITIWIGAGAIGSIVDPNGASTGRRPDGVAYNQIPGSRILAQDNGVQELIIPAPVAGEYSLVLRLTGSESVNFDIAGTSGGQVAFRHADEVRGGNGYIIRFSLEAANGQVTGGQAGDIAPLGGENPERIVMPKPASQDSAIARQTGPDGRGREFASVIAERPEQPEPVDNDQPDEFLDDAAEDGDNTGLEVAAADELNPENGNANQPGTGKDKDKDNPGQPVDPSSNAAANSDWPDEPEQTTEPPGQSGDTPGQSGDTPGQSGDTPGQSGDTPGQSGDPPGQSGDTPGQSGDTPGQSGNDPGQSGDTPGQPEDTPGQSDGEDGDDGDDDDDDDGVVSDLLGGVGDLLGGLLGH
jgi:hypothetical protein